MSTSEAQQVPATTSNTDIFQPDESTSTSQPLRRSSRRAEKPARLSSGPSSPVRRAKKPLAVNNSKTMTEPRRNPKRKASDLVKHLDGMPSDLLQEALRPLDPKEIEEWEGWIELESEPAFFNIILRDLGVKNVKAQELFTLDQDSVDFLPKPVFGLIFLFQYLPGFDDTEDEDDVGDVWFANQTTQNACATVALLNIVMNAPEAELGNQLKKFKESTKGLNTALRGHRLGSNTFIRSIHNSFTRRMDQLNADLGLENEASEPKTKKSKNRTAAKKGKGQRRRKVAEDDYAFHFVAYVPADGQVWELDGLKTKPHKLGPIKSDDWTTVARPQIEARMLQYEDSQLSFNLLALCQSPLAVHSHKIAKNLASLRLLRESLQSKLAFEPCSPWTDETKTSSFLSEFQLTDSDVENAAIPQDFQERVLKVDSSQEAHELYNSIMTDTKATIGEYRAELVSMAEDEQRVKGRRKDYGPALHKWVAKLAEKGVLEDLIRCT